MAVNTLSEDDESNVPTTTVRQTDVAIEVSARGELQGGGARPLIVPRAGVAELPITFLRSTGDLVKAGDVVAEFDPSAQQSDLLEAEADLEEARQQQIKAEAETFVALEKARLEVATSEFDLKVSELDQLENQFLGSVQQRKNGIAFEQARNRHDQALVDLSHREGAKQTGVDVQRAAVKEAQTKVDTTRQTLAGLTLRAPASGYVQLAENTNGLSVLFYGMSVPTFQLGDSARPGQMVAQIPDMSGWEVSTQIPETDRAFLATGQQAIVRPKAMPGREFKGHISLLGGSAGSAWNRTFNCRIALDDADDALRPGLSVDVVIRVETLANVLWVPSQAVFEREGRWFVYRQAPEGYVSHPVTIVRRTESQAVVTGIDKGATIALAEPGRRTTQRAVQPVRLERSANDEDPVRPRAGARQPSSAEDPHAAHGVGHRLWRRLGHRHDGHRRRGEGRDRCGSSNSSACATSSIDSRAGVEPAGDAAAAAVVARAHAPRLADSPHQHRRDRGDLGAQDDASGDDAAQARAGSAGDLRRASILQPDPQPPLRRGRFLRRLGQPDERRRRRAR